METSEKTHNHDCCNYMETGEVGKCLFCRLNDELINNGVAAFAVPYDTPNVYDFNKEPYIVFSAPGEPNIEVLIDDLEAVVNACALPQSLFERKFLN